MSISNKNYYNLIQNGIKHKKHYLTRGIDTEQILIDNVLFLHHEIQMYCRIKDKTIPIGNNPLYSFASRKDHSMNNPLYNKIPLVEKYIGLLKKIDNNTQQSVYDNQTGMPCVSTRMYRAVPYYYIGFILKSKLKNIASVHLKDAMSGILKEICINQEEETKRKLLEETENILNDDNVMGGEIILNHVTPKNIYAIYLTNIKTPTDTGGIIRKGKYPINEVAVIVLQELVKRYTNSQLSIYYLDYDFYTKIFNKSINELVPLDRMEIINKIINEYKTSKYLSNTFLLYDDITKDLLKFTYVIVETKNDVVNEFINNYTYIEDKTSLIRLRYNFIEYYNKTKKDEKFKKMYNEDFYIKRQQAQDDDIILAHSDYLVKEIRSLYDKYLEDKIPIPIKIVTAIEVSKIEIVNLKFHNQLEDAKSRGFNMFDLD